MSKGAFEREARVLKESCRALEGLCRQAVLDADVLAENFLYGARERVEDATLQSNVLGWRAVLPLVDLDRYLPYLVRRLSAAGGTLTRLALATLPARGVVVNCTGLGSFTLFDDKELVPIKGQLTHVVPQPDVTYRASARLADGGLQVGGEVVARVTDTTLEDGPVDIYVRPGDLRATGFHQAEGLVVRAYHCGEVSEPRPAVLQRMVAARP